MSRRGNLIMRSLRLGAPCREVVACGEYVVGWQLISAFLMNLQRVPHWCLYEASLKWSDKMTNLTIRMVVAKFGLWWLCAPGIQSLSFLNLLLNLLSGICQTRSKAFEGVRSHPSLIRQCRLNTLRRFVYHPEVSPSSVGRLKELLRFQMVSYCIGNIHCLYLLFRLSNSNYKYTFLKSIFENLSPFARFWRHWSKSGTGWEWVTITGLMVLRKSPQIRIWPFVFTTFTVGVAHCKGVTFGSTLSIIPSSTKRWSSISMFLRMKNLTGRAGTCLGTVPGFIWMLNS